MRICIFSSHRLRWSACAIKAISMCRKVDAFANQKGNAPSSYQTGKMLSSDR